MYRLNREINRCERPFKRTRKERKVLREVKGRYAGRNVLPAVQSKLPTLICPGRDNAEITRRLECDAVTERKRDSAARHKKRVVAEFTVGRRKENYDASFICDHILFETALSSNSCFFFWPLKSFFISSNIISDNVICRRYNT